MLAATAVVGMALTALVMALTPGPNMMYLVSRSISGGRRAGLISLIGTGLGFVVYMSMANLGLAVVFTAVPWLYAALKAVGAVYIAYLAWQALRPGGSGVFEARDLPKDSNWKLLQMGLLTNLLNPKAAIMYLTLIPQFIDPHRGHVAAQGFLLGAVQIVVSMLVNGVVVLAAGSVARFMVSRPKWTLWQRRATGTLLGGIAVMLAREVPERAHA